MTTRPLILMTNDDGVHSPGIQQAAEALMDLGDVLIAAPWEEQSSTGRSMRRDATRIIHTCEMMLDGHRTTAYGIEGTPAQAVQHGVLELTSRKPDLLVSGINYGENMGRSVTISGTVMAAYEGAAWGIPALAVSLQMNKEEQMALSADTDVSVAAFFTRMFAEMLLTNDFPDDVDILKVDVPKTATKATPWRLTRLSHQSYYIAHRPARRDFHTPLELGWEMSYDLDTLEPDSDIYALNVDNMVSVTPLSMDFSARVALPELELRLRESGH